MLEDRYVALGEDTDDLLGQKPAVRMLGDVCRGVRAPACVAVYGSWGSGKTNLLHNVYDAWPAGQRVWFDPWAYADREDVVTPLLSQMVRDLDEVSGFRSPETIALAKGVAKSVLSIGGRVAMAFAGLGLLNDPNMLRALAPVLGLNTEAVGGHFDPLEDDVEKARDDFAKLIALATGDDPDARVLICLDDLDRCLPESVVALIEAIKVVLCAGGTVDPWPDDESRPAVVFAFALDRQIVGEAIRKKYGAASLYTGENYLEKVFDFSLEVPPVPEQDLHAFCTNELTKLGDLQRFPGGLGEVSHALKSPVFANPRVIKRALSRAWLLLGDDESKGRVEAIVDKPRFYQWLAGTERFRTFRHFFRTASLDELRALDHAVKAVATPNPQASELPGAVRALFETPGYLELHTMLFEGTTPEAERRPDGSRLRDFDDLMRRVGL